MNMKAGIKYLLASLSICIFLSGLVNAAEQDYFDVYALEIEGVIHNFLTGRFNDDPLIDISVIYYTNGKRYTRYNGLYIPA